MANPIRGLYPLRGWRGDTTVCYVPSGDATALFVGDLVKFSTDGDAIAGMGRMGVVQAAASSSTNIHVGVVMSIDQVMGVAIGSENLNRKHRPASTAMFVNVITDPQVIYGIRSDDDAGAGDQTHIGSNGDIIVAAGNTSTGYSGMQLDTSSITTTATLPLKIVGIVQRPGNIISAGLLDYEVIINTSYWHFGTVGNAV